MIKKVIWKTKNALYRLKAMWCLRHDVGRICWFLQWEGGFYRSPGLWYRHDLEQYADLVKNVPGAFAEIGVRYGLCFRQLIPLAKAQAKPIYAIDSFEGTKKNSELDSRPDGNMSIGGADVFFTEMKKAGFSRNQFETAVGWIPEVFNKLPADITFSFVVLDVDNYTPTTDSLAYVWPRLSPGGLLLMDDFITHHPIDASRAMREFLREHDDCWIERILPNYQIILRKLSPEKMNGSE